MSIGAIPSSFANAVVPFNPVGKQAVGEEDTETKESPLKAIEESSETLRSDNRDDKGDPDKLVDRASVTPVAGDDQQAAEEEPEESGQKDDKTLSGEQSPRDPADRKELEERRAKIRELANRDREVRNHERAHLAVGGPYTGAVTYSYEQGPNGLNYAVEGEVAIDTTKIKDNPQATIDKAQQIRRAALAPAEPSAQDRRVAAQAAQMEAQARRELLEAKQAQEQAESRAENTENTESASADEGESRARRPDPRLAAFQTDQTVGAGNFIHESV